MSVKIKTILLSLLLMFCSLFANAEQKVVLISGASKGVGLASVKAFCQKGWKVWAGYRQTIPEDLKEIPGIRWCQLDVTLDDQVNQVIKNILAEDGRLDALINNAGFGVVGAEETVTIEEAEQLFQVNFFGVMRLTQAVLPIMRQQGSGHILNISSGVGIQAIPGLGIYSASKFALEGFSESLAATVSPWNIKVSIIEPGFIQNDWALHCLLGSRKCECDFYSQLNAHIYQWLTTSRAYGQSCDEIANLLVMIAENPEPNLRYQTSDGVKEWLSEKLVDPTGNQTLQSNKEFLKRFLSKSL